SSRARSKKVDPLELQLLDTVRVAIARSASHLSDATVQAAEPLRRQPTSERRAPNQTVALALSGGRDSMALLDLLARLTATRGTGIRRVIAIHVHHGLSRSADAWLAHCEAECAQRGVPLVVRRVEVKRRGRGIEAAAREVRYVALAEAAREAGARIVLTAHHRDDRLETFLLQWMRGAGLDGLAAFPPARTFSVDLQLLRPLIDVGRADIERYIELRHVRYVDDDSNDDTSLLRNVVRSEVLPRIDALRPGFRPAAARSIDLVAEAAEAVRSTAAADLIACSEGAPDGMLWLDRIAALPLSRQTGVLRAWLAREGLEAPSRARLLEVLEQAGNVRSDARMLVRLGDREVRRYRGLLLLKYADDSDRDAYTLQWQGEDEIPIAGWGGVLKFSAVSGEGFDPDWLRAAPLEVRPRGGGERFKPHPSRPSKTLKRLFQDAAIPEFNRGRLPLLWREDELIFVAGLGADVRFTDRDGKRIVIEWEPDASLIEHDS
ncbi:MAG TPA: tRNA lysidine(34) synthetase TilS, partial [Burkholderiaceae bacterium]|nr:tRNA lysidine(34) synthetase TilS [Burkholderiaceae bacterium]